MCVSSVAPAHWTSCVPPLCKVLLFAQLLPVLGTITRTILDDPSQTCHIGQRVAAEARRANRRRSHVAQQASGGTAAPTLDGSRAACPARRRGPERGRRRVRARAGRRSEEAHAARRMVRPVRRRNSRTAVSLRRPECQPESRHGAGLRRREQGRRLCTHLGYRVRHRGRRDGTRPRPAHRTGSTTRRRRDRVVRRACERRARRALHERGGATQGIQRHHRSLLADDGRLRHRRRRARRSRRERSARGRVEGCARRRTRGGPRTCDLAHRTGRSVGHDR